MRARSRIATALAAVALLVPAGGVAASAGDNPADELAGAPMDEYRYDHAERCRESPPAGMRALERWLDRNVRGETWGIMRCERLGSHFSLHSEGRAIDWRLDKGVRGERRAAKRLVRLLLADDKRGEPHALARRMGVQEIIWDCESWYSGAGGLRPYGPCESRSVSKTTAHRDHVHLGLNWPGARERTSFWSR